MPHLQAAHCISSSVVPAKSPSTRLKPDQSVRVLALARLPRLLLAVVFAGRISAAGRTRALHSAPLGKTAPTGSVTNLPDAGGTPTRLAGADAVAPVLPMVVIGAAQTADTKGIAPAVAANTTERAISLIRAMPARVFNVAPR